MKIKRIFLWAVLVALAAQWMMAPVAFTRAASIIRVTTSGAASGACGSTWAAACALQHALNDIAAPGDELWVAAGVYKPTTGGDRAATFQLLTGVAIYGGFAGTETARSQRDWTANLTILSGEIGAAGNSDNSYHVVTGSGTDNTAILDGFTMTGGNANGSGADENIGGGMVNYYGSPTIQNTILSNNSALEKGGGMFNDHSSPTLTGVTFDENTAGGTGGGMSNSYSHPILTRVTFNANSVTGGNGGAMYNDYSSPTLTSVTFSANSATAGNGGAMYNDLDSQPTLTNVTFSGNSATMDSGFNGGNGGAIYNYATTAPPRLTNVTFSGNQALDYDALHPAYGGAMYTVAGSALITNTILWGNLPDQIYDDGSSMMLYNSVAQGGCPTGVTCSSIITDDPLLGILGDYGGGVQTIPLLPASSALDTAHDTACPADDARGVARPQGAHCDIGAFESSRFTLAIAGGNNQSALVNAAFAQPLWVSVIANNASEPVNGGKVTFTPPALGASASLATSPAAIASGAASVNATANGIRGWYPVTATMAGANSVSFNLRNLKPTIFYVKPGASGSCAAWATACELQTALGLATYGDEIWVAAGTYKPTGDSDRNASFQLVNGAALYGGFAGTETARSQRNWVANIVVLSGDIGAAGDSSDNSYNVVTANETDSQTVLDGVTVTGGRGTGQVGGGVYVHNGSLTLANCRIADNSADYGGGLFQDGSDGRVDVSNCRIELNTTANHGGGLYVGGNVALTDTLVLSNTAVWHGGGLHVTAGRAELAGGLFGNNRASGGNGGGVNVNNGVSVSGTQFISNTASSGGGLLQWNAGYTVTVTNARFERNSAQADGGGLWAHGSTVVTGTLVYSNSAANWGGGLYVQAGPTIVNGSTFSGNTSARWGGGIALNGGAAQLNRSLVVSNIADSHGGGIDVWAASLRLTNAVVANNHAFLGNGVYLYNSPLNALHTTIARNSGGQGHGIYVDHDLSPNTVALTDTILVSQTTGITATAGNTVTLNGVLWFGNGANTGGAGSVSAQNETTGDPAFAADGYHLTSRSAAIDHGVNSGVTSDIDGDRRPMGSGYDLGADEFKFTVYLPIVMRQ